MDTQEVFDTVARHLMTQKGQSRNTASCLYRGDNGKKCAIGVLIPDSMYQPRMEGIGVKRLMDLFPDIRLIFLDVIPTSTIIRGFFLSSLQQAHDDLDSWVESKFVGHAMLKRIGIEYRLDISVLS